MVLSVATISAGSAVAQSNTAPAAAKGDARGHREGDTLVVETTNFTARSAYRNANLKDMLEVTRAHDHEVH